MLPSAEEVDDDNPAKFADSGTELLIEEMQRRGADVTGIEAKIAGGSDMLDFSESGSSIGTRNAEQVRVTLQDHGIPIVGEDVGGDHGRSLRLEAPSGDLVVKSANETDRRL
jgi:chemotaxis protein CheD